ncbi:unnamed protein product [Candida verbasci]|uniref:Peroxisome assembly protein 22 n=1 Tax=Candida verbasci TaxID=1227364 RepID=A0A9W4TW79_9ASCO|nr:unnamed protein product [Candida verbasci]
MSLSSKTKQANLNPKLYLTAVIATSVIAISYKIYETYFKEKTIDNKDNNTTTTFSISRKYLNKNIAITLSSSFLSSKLPLNDILTSSENVIFIIPPNLNEDDLTLTIPPNFKLLKSSNFQGYLQILKNLKPDLLLLCSDDLGINYSNLTNDLNNFINKIVNLEQNDFEESFQKLLMV